RQRRLQRRRSARPDRATTPRPATTPGNKQQIVRCGSIDVRSGRPSGAYSGTTIATEAGGRRVLLTRLSAQFTLLQKARKTGLFAWLYMPPGSHCVTAIQGPLWARVWAGGAKAKRATRQEPFQTWPLRRRRRPLAPSARS